MQRLGWLWDWRSMLYGHGWKTLLSSSWLCGINAVLEKRILHIFHSEWIFEESPVLVRRNQLLSKCLQPQNCFSWKQYWYIRDHNTEKVLLSVETASFFMNFQSREKSLWWKPLPSQRTSQKYLGLAHFVTSYKEIICTTCAQIYLLASSCCNIILSKEITYKTVKVDHVQGSVH